MRERCDDVQVTNETEDSKDARRISCGPMARPQPKERWRKRASVVTEPRGILCLRHGREVPWCTSATGKLRYVCVGSGIAHTHSQFSRIYAGVVRDKQARENRDVTVETACQRDKRS